MLVLARLLPPEAIAPLATYVMVTAVPVAVATLRLDDAVAIARSEARGRAVTALAVRALLMMTALTGAGMLVVSWLGILPELQGWIWLAAAGHVAAMGAWRVDCAWLLRNRQMQQWVLADTAGPFCLALLQVTLGWATGSVHAVLWAFPSAYLLSWWWASRSAPRGLWSLAGTRALVKRGWRLGNRFPRFLVPYTVLGTVRDRAIIAALRDLSTAAVGLFFMAERVAILPGMVVTGALRPVTQVVGGQGSSHELRRVVERVTVLLCPLAGLTAGICCAFLEPIVVLLLGGEYSDAAAYLLALAPAGLVMACSNWLDRLFHISGTQRAALCAEGIGTACVVAATAAAAMLSGDGVTVAWAYGCTFAAYQVVWWALALERGIGRIRSLWVGLGLLTVGVPTGLAIGSMAKALLGLQ